MRAINTMKFDEYAKRLSDAMQRMYKTLSRLSDEETSKSRIADNKGDEEEALRHEFNARAIDWAMNAIVLSPDEIEKRLMMRKIKTKGSER